MNAQNAIRQSADDTLDDAFAGWDRSVFLACHRAVLDILMALPPGSHRNLLDNTISGLALLAAALLDAAGGES
ncbi:MAG TPA: hypothetical protein VFL78_11690 [Rhodanobacteraceae bacterium]|nr:hypothetical protein [Rhodanobacteraceae bacterium]